ncbi:MAG: hypothetical protein KA957_03480 [Syntrophaceae bacterium]|nr:hypothetical protein [Syntrophaceae bacterium]
MGKECSPVPWKLDFDDTGLPRAIKDADGEHITFIDKSRYVDGTHDPVATANAELIIHAVNCYPALKAALITARETIQDRERLLLPDAELSSASFGDVFLWELLQAAPERRLIDAAIALAELK